MANRTKMTAEKMEEFITELSNHGNVTATCAKVGISRMCAYAHRAENAAFRDAWDAAVDLGVEAMEDEATRRAVEGWDEPVFFQGSECGVVRKYSDTLLMFRLKALRPEKYRERRENTNTNQFIGKDGQPVDAVASINVTIGAG